MLLPQSVIWSMNSQKRQNFDLKFRPTGDLKLVARTMNLMVAKMKINCHYFAWKSYNWFKNVK